MKKLISSIALCGLVVMAACSGDSPTAKPVPTVVPDEWAIVSLTASDTSPYIGAAVLIEAVVQQNGGDPPNGTTIEFLASGGAFPNGTTEASVGTVGGRASISHTAAAAGSYVIQARIRGVSRQVTVNYRDPDVDEDLIIQLPLIPDVGSFDGGETVILRGSGIRTPVEVMFDVQGVLYPAIIGEVIESDPLSAPGQITITTPLISQADRSEPRTANVIVKRGVGTASELMITLPSAFTFMDVVVGGPPTIYALEPPYGGREGGDQINVLGRNLEDVTRATFSFRGNDLNADILTISPDGFQAVISTPRFSATPLTESEFADFVVDSPGGLSNTLTQAFLVVADDPTPEIASLSPIAGPLGGGTLVSIFGSGFMMPVQVRFGNLTATDVNLIDDQSPADQDVITCLSPDYSQQGQVPPVTVDVTVTNMLSGRTSNARQFIYGDNLFISGNSPSEGRPGDQVVIFGAGFEDPLQVFFAGEALDVQSVSGTEILARFPADMPVTCSDRGGQFEVRLIESNQNATGGNFTLLGNRPTVVDVEPTFVQADVTGNFVDPADITVMGADFADTLLVRINQYVMPNGSVMVVDETTIEVTGIPAPNQFGLVFDTTPCITNDGLQGIRKAPTAVDVTVTNLPGSCPDTLVGGLIYEPGDTTCVAASAIVVDPLVFDPTQAPGCSAGVDLVVSNTGGGTLEVFQMNLQGRFFFDGAASNQVAPGFLVPPFGSVTPQQVFFCPDADNGGTYSGGLSIQNNSPANPLSVTLTATEAFPILGVSTNNVDFGPQTVNTGIQALPLTITNSGTGDLNWTVSGVNSTVFLRLGPGNPVNSGTVPAGGSTALEVALDTASGVTGPVDVTLTITATEPDAEGSPQSVQVTATINNP
jgi:hypothetical protein